MKKQMTKHGSKLHLRVIQIFLRKTNLGIHYGQPILERNKDGQRFIW